MKVHVGRRKLICLLEARNTRSFWSRLSSASTSYNRYSQDFFLSIQTGYFSSKPKFSTLKHPSLPLRGKWTFENSTFLEISFSIGTCPYHQQINIMTIDFQRVKPQNFIVNTAFLGLSRTFLNGRI